MKNRKNIMNDEPLWKKRRKEEAREARRTKLWTVCVISAISIVLGLMVWMMVLRPLTSEKDEPKTQPQSALATVADKIVEKKDGKTTHRIIFKIGKNTKVQKEVDEKAFGSIEKDKEYLLTYEANPFTGMPTKVIKWEVPKFAKPM